jgi:hypothetical protein
MLVVVELGNNRFVVGTLGYRLLEVRSRHIAVGPRIVAVGFLRRALRRVGLGMGCMGLGCGSCRLRT